MNEKQHSLRPDLTSHLRRLWECGIPVLLAVLLPSIATAEDSSRSFESFTKPYRSIQVAAGEPGRIATVSIDRGDHVKVGQTILVLDTRILEANRRVAVAEAAATARIDALKIEHELKQRRWKQFEALSEGGHGSSEELQRARADEQIALANLRAEEESRQQRQLKVEEIETRIAARTVMSPINGVVSDVSKEPGEFVSATAPEVATIVDLTQLRASFFVPTTIAAGLNRDQTLHVLLTASGRTVSAVVEHVGVVTQADSGRVRIDVVMNNHKQELRSGIRCRLLLAVRTTSANSRTATAELRSPRVPLTAHRFVDPEQQ